MFHNIGTCNGKYALYATFQYNQLYAVKTNPVFHKMLLRKIELNCKNIILTLPFAISDRNGEVTPYTYVVVVNPQVWKTPNNRTMQVPCTSLEI
jgi:hypothetical protein